MVCRLEGVLKGIEGIDSDCLGLVGLAGVSFPGYSF